MSLFCEPCVSIETPNIQPVMRDMDADEFMMQMFSTAEDRAILEEAQEGLRQELWAKVQAGAITKLKYHRIMKNIDQQTLAGKVGMTQGNLSRLENARGMSRIDLGLFKKIAKALGVEYKELLP